MTSGDHAEPRIVMSTDAAGVAAIDAIVARRRSAVARLALGARMARQRLDRVEAEQAERSAGAEGGDAPEDLLATVDLMLDRAMKACHDALEDARSEADAMVADALGSAGDGAVAGGPTRADRRPGLDQRVTPPPSAVELWQGLRRVARQPKMFLAGPDAVASVRADVARVPALLPVSSLPVPSDLGGDALDPVQAVPVVGTLVLDAPPDDWFGVASEDAFDSFWEEARGERRVRDRLLRRSSRGDS